jgi:hypothetical protein
MYIADPDITKDLTVEFGAGFHDNNDADVASTAAA